MFFEALKLVLDKYNIIVISKSVEIVVLSCVNNYPILVLHKLNAAIDSCVHLRR